MAYEIRKIDIRTYGELVVEEATASATIYPGALVSVVNGAVTNHAVAGGFTPHKIAMSRAELGELITDTYANGDKVRINTPRAGDVYAIRLKASENVAKGDYLVSNGDGTFKKAPATAAYILFRALDASNVASVAYIRAEVVGPVYNPAVPST